MTGKDYFLNGSVALMRQILPLEFANKRAKHVRNRLYAIAAKVLQHGRQVIVKCQATNQNPKKPSHSSLASIKIQTIPPI
jgi:hypothetical protein